MTRALHSSEQAAQSLHLPSAHLAMLEMRAGLLGAVRRFFGSRGYLEVETPILSRDIVVDAHLEPFVTHWLSDARSASGETLYLQTSPEFAMKRLLAAGATAIYQVARVMRNGECGRHHNPEFTMVEWYRVGDTHLDQMRVVEELVHAVCQQAAVFAPSGLVVPERPFGRLTYDEAFAQFAGTRVLHLTGKELAQLARRYEMVPPPGLAGDDRDGWLNYLLAELVEPKLGMTRPEFLYDYPASQAALARVREDDPPVAERFELYFRGIELCNGYHELTDAAELRTRMQSQAERRRRHGAMPLPMENRLLEAMEAALPPCAGVALGFDRLVMLATGAASVAEVMAFSFERA